MLTNTISSAASRMLLRCPRSGSALARPLGRSPFVLSTSSPFSTLILSEPVDGSAAVVPAATCAAVTAALSIESAWGSAGNKNIDLLVVGPTVPQQVPTGVNKIIHCPTANAHPVAETVAACVTQATKQSSYQYVVGTNTKMGATVLPRAAALLNVSPITDIMQLRTAGSNAAPNTFVRPMYAGNALCVVQGDANAPLQVLSIRPTSFEKAALQPASGIPVETVSVQEFAQAVWVSESVSGAGAGAKRADLSTAAVVVSGGRGMQSSDNFVLLEGLADALGGGAVGASRAAVDSGMAPNDLQVGQTGKVVAPNLYIAVGISGAIQHLSGMKDSKTIVAINKDPEAPIFQVADYGLVADLFTAVPELTQKLAASK